MQKPGGPAGGREGRPGTNQAGRSRPLHGDGPTRHAGNRPAFIACSSSSRLSAGAPARTHLRDPVWPRGRGTRVPGVIRSCKEKTTMAIDGFGEQSGKEAGLLVVEDDPSHRSVLERAFEKRGYRVKSAGSVPQALEVLDDWPAGYAVIDLRLPGSSGLTLIPPLKLGNPGMRIVVMTGYGSIATAVEAIKRAFQRMQGDQSVTPLAQRLSVSRLAWEHIHGALADYGGNISAAARALGMHRRTLQRKLAKSPART